MQQGNLFNIEQGRAARDAGMQKAVDTTEKLVDNWSEIAYSLLLDFLSVHHGPFQAEEVRSHAAMREDFPLPVSSRAWGAVFFRAAKNGLISRQGYAPVTNPKAHRTPAAVWIKNNKAA